MYTFGDWDNIGIHLGGNILQNSSNGGVQFQAKRAEYKIAISCKIKHDQWAILGEC